MVPNWTNKTGDGSLSGCRKGTDLKNINKTPYAVVTGAAGGMGYASVQALIKEGYTVIGLDIHKPHTLPGLIYIPADLTDPVSVQQAFDVVHDFTDTIDCIIHLSGIYDLGSLVEMNEERFLRIFNINLFAVYRVNRVFLPLLKQGGRILITTSELAPLDPLPFTGIYAVTKAALDKYAYSLRMELQLLGYDVCVLRPGAVSTGMLPASMQALQDFCEKTVLYTTNADRFQKIVGGIEAKNVPPEKVAALVMKVLSDRKPRYVYTLNRNPLLLIMDLLPDRLQNLLIRKLLR